MMLVLRGLPEAAQGPKAITCSIRHPQLSPPWPPSPTITPSDRLPGKPLAFTPSSASEGAQSEACTHK